LSQLFKGIGEEILGELAHGYIVGEDENMRLPVAIAEGKPYFGLQTAVNNVSDGGTITLLSDIALSAQNAQEYFKPAYNRESYCGLYIPDDKKITLELNGKTVSYVDEYEDIDNVMVLNFGNLTVNDSVGGGKITYKPVASTSSYSKFYSTVFNCGTLTVNGGTIENTSEVEWDVTNAIDNHSRLSHEYKNDCILTVNGGTVTGSYYYAIRQYTHYFEGVKNRVVINDGTINGGIYMQHGDSWYYADPAKNRLNVDGQLEINGGVINTNYEWPDQAIRSFLANPDNNAWKIAVNGGELNGKIDLRVQRGYYYLNGVSGALGYPEANGARNAEWLANNGGFLYSGVLEDIGTPDSVTNNATAFLAEDRVFKANEEGKYEVRFDYSDEVEVDLTEETPEITVEFYEKNSDGEYEPIEITVVLADEDVTVS